MELIAQKLLQKCFLSGKIKSGTIRTTEKGGVKQEAQEDGNPEKGWESVCSRKAELVGGMKRPDMTKSQSCFSLARCLEGTEEQVQKIKSMGGLRVQGPQQSAGLEEGD